MVPEELAHGLRLAGASASRLVWEAAVPTGAAPRARVIRVPGVADFTVTAGRRVDISRADGADEAEVRASFDGRVIAALLQQRGTVPLHLAAVVIGGHAVGFAGPPAAGKSSLACALADRGHSLLADDLAALRWDANGRPLLHPGPARMRTWGSSARALGWPTDDASRVGAGVDKYAYPLPERFARGPQRLGMVFVLVQHSGDDVRIARLEGFSKFEAYFAAGAAYDRELLDTPRARGWHFAEVCRLADQVPTFELGVPAGGLPLGRLAAAVERHASPPARAHPGGPDGLDRPGTTPTRRRGGRRLGRRAAGRAPDPERGVRRTRRHGVARVAAGGAGHEPPRARTRTRTWTRTWAS